MEKVKLRFTIDDIDAKRSGEILIDSGGTHHFLHDRSLLRNFKDMEPKQVLSASGLSQVCGTGEVWVSFIGGIWITAFYKQNFSTQILSVHQLSMEFNICFTRDEDGYDNTSV